MKDCIAIKNNLIVQFVRSGKLYASEDHFVFESGDGGKNWQKICRIAPPGEPVAKITDRILRAGVVRLVRRNIGIHNVAVLRSGTVIIQYDGIYRAQKGEKTARKVFSFKRDNIRGPLTNGLCVDDTTGNLYFGEYQNQRPCAVRIFRGSNDGGVWEECYRFEKGRVRHVHSIVPDPYRKRLWVSTGDNDRESGLFYTDNDFKSLDLFGGGDQMWRMVCPAVTENAIYWGSDAGKDAPPDKVNFIYKWDFREGERKRLQRIDNPAYYSTVQKNGTIAIGVHYEPGMRREVDKKADIWTSTDGEKWYKRVSLEFKPSGRKNGTKYASMFLPQGDGSVNDIFFSPFNVRKYDFKLMKLIHE